MVKSESPLNVDEARKKLEELSPERRALLAQLLRKKAMEQEGGMRRMEPGLPEIVPDPAGRYAPFPLTELQQAYWFGRTSAFEMGAVVSCAYVEVERAGLDLHRFEQAWERLTARHDMLRAVVLPDGRQQVLETVPPYRVEVLDLRGLPADAAEARLKEISQAILDDLRPADEWPLYDIRAARLDGDRTRLHFRFDLLAFDAASITKLFRELTILYDNPAAELKPLEITYRDYVLAARKILDSPLYKKSREYWMNRLTTLPPAPDLPLAKSPGAVEKPRFSRRRARVDADTWSRLKKRAALVDVTPTGVLLTIFADVLATWSKSPRLTVNIPLFNRLNLHPQINDIVGYFDTLLLLGFDPAPDETFEARAKRAQAQIWSDLEHRYMDGVEVLRELAAMKGSQSEARMPVVFTSVIDEKFDTVVSQFGKIARGVNPTSQVWLDLHVDEQDGDLIVKWDAVDELFPPGVMDEMLEAFVRLIRRLAGEEAAWHRVERDLLPPAQAEMQKQYNATGAPVPHGLLQDRIEEQVHQRPDHPAVIAGNHVLSYQELYRRANRIGRRLRDEGAKPNQLVAIIMEKGWEQAAGVLGVIHSGAAYLPIDPEFPKDRIWHLLEHGQVRFVLTQSWIQKKLEWPESVQVMSVDEENAWAGIADSRLEPVQNPRDLAYVIYTSGSTGLPKGVMEEHEGVLNTVIDINERFGVTHADRGFLLSSLGFDLSVYDIFGLLSAGGTIVFPDPAGVRDPAHWAEQIERHGVTIWNTVPALMQLLVDYISSQGQRLTPTLRLVLLSGDWIPVNLPDQIRSLGNGPRVISLGGATEASIWSILYPIERVDPAWKSIPYGRPMVNQRFYVLNEALEPCPVWVAGELYIGGIGLARGYWRDEEKTNARFITHPRTGERLYRTGDLGRFLPDGNIEFIGRADFQVKIRGYRIELGEIENILTQHPAVREAVVTAVGQSQKDKRLVAYIVPEGASQTEGAPLDTRIAKGGNGRPDGSAAVLTDPLKRLEFKLQHHAIRQDEDKPTYALPKHLASERAREAYLARQSYRRFLESPLLLERFGRFLDCLSKLEIEHSPLPKYRYPSAGGLYPVQVYLYVKPGRVAGVPGGTYYYHPEQHRLVQISAEAPIPHDIHTPNNFDIFESSAFSIFLVGRMNAIAPLYGEASRDFCLLEAGYMSQLLMEAAAEWDIGLCPIGGVIFDRVREAFGLDEGHEYLHCLCGGAIDPAQKRVFSFLDESTASSMMMTLPASAQSGVDELRPENLRAYLAEKLPDYMIPAAFVRLEALPLSSNGKVDRRALPEPEGLPAESGVAFVRPETEIEQTIAAVWREALDTERVGIDDNFFDLGGNSLRIIQVHMKLRERIQKDLALVDLFRFPTIRALSAFLSQGEDLRPEMSGSVSRADTRRALRNRRQPAR